MTTAGADILLVDDDLELCELLEEYLGDEGFAVTTAHDGGSGLSSAAGGAWAAVILDVMLPEKNGFDVLRELRATGADTPVIMLTARGGDVDRIVGLEMGADDYLPKPFNPRELVARIRAVMRRSGRADRARDGETLAVDGVSLHLPSRSATLDGHELSLTTAEFAVLEALLEQAGAIVTRDDLCQRALGRRLAAIDRSVDVHVSNLRRKIGKERIKTVRGHGYLFVRAPAAP